MPLQSRDVSPEFTQTSNDLTEFALVHFKQLARFLFQVAELVAAFLQIVVEVVALRLDAALAHMMEDAVLLSEDLSIEIIIWVLLVHQVELRIRREIEVFFIINTPKPQNPICV